MYKIYCDDELIYDPRVKELSMTDLSVEIELNGADALEMSIPPCHPFYDTIKRMTSTIKVVDDDAIIFEGRATEDSINFQNNRKVYCEGALAFLNDSIQRPSENHDMTVLAFITQLLNNHNSQVEKNRQFTIGAVTVSDSNDSIYRYTNYENTLEAIKDKLLNRLGGYLRIRYEGDKRYLDYLAEMPNTCQQTIEFGKNLLDYASNVDTSEIATRIIPLGTTLDNSKYAAIDERLTIESVNDGIDYLQADNAVATYGVVTKVAIWDDVTTAEALMKKGMEYLTAVQWESMQLDVSAVDLHKLDGNIEQIKLGDKILAKSAPHGLNKYFPVTKMQIDLLDPASNKITLGDSVNIGITNRVNTVEVTAEKTDKSKSSLLQQAKLNASNLIKMATNGYIVFNNDDNGNPKELLIMDTPDIKTATKVWRWNMNGLGYSSAGYNGTYGTAITMDGQIVADFIKAGVITGIKIKNGNGFEVDSVGNMKATSGKIADWIINSTAIYKDVKDPSNSNIVYRTYFQPPISSNVSKTWILSCQKSTDGGNTFNGIFVLYSDGSATFGNGKININSDGSATFGNGSMTIHANGSVYLANGLTKLFSTGGAYFANDSLRIIVNKSGYGVFEVAARDNPNNFYAGYTGDVTVDGKTLKFITGILVSVS